MDKLRTSISDSEIEYYFNTPKRHKLKIDILNRVFSERQLYKYYDKLGLKSILYTQKVSEQFLIDKYQDLKDLSKKALNRFLDYNRDLSRDFVLKYIFPLINSSEYIRYNRNITQEDLDNKFLQMPIENHVLLMLLEDDFNTKFLTLISNYLIPENILEKYYKPDFIDLIIAQQVVSEKFFLNHLNDIENYCDSDDYLFFCVNNKVSKQFFNTYIRKTIDLNITNSIYFSEIAKYLQ